MGCTGAGRDAGGAQSDDSTQQASEPSTCPATLPGEVLLPGVAPEHRTLEYWLSELEDQVELDEVLIDAAGIAAHNYAMTAPRGEQAPYRADLLAPPDRAQLLREVQERLAWLQERGADRRYVNAEGGALSAEELAAFDSVGSLSPEPELRVALELTPIRCGPRLEGLYTQSLNLNFDRNNCSTVHPQEPIQVIQAWGDMFLVRSAYTLGWIPNTTALSPPVPDGLQASIVRGRSKRTIGATSFTANDGSVYTLPSETFVAPVEQSEGVPSVIVATANGFDEVPLGDAGLANTTTPLTRRNLLEFAFSQLDHPYGWGGSNGGQDCSRFTMDTFAAFGLEMPRFSGHQANAGTFSIDTSTIEKDSDKVLLLDAANAKGVVLLHFPGHIMLYLGRNADGEPMAIHSFAEYLVPCGDLSTAENDETLFTVDRVNVSNMELGRGSSRTSFIERLTRITVIGEAPGHELQGIAEPRAPAPVVVPPREECDDTVETAIFATPRNPNREQPLQVLVSARVDHGPAELVLINPDGERIVPEYEQFSGPPFSRVIRIEEPQVGTWTAVFGDGNNVHACQRIRVRDHRERNPGDSGPVWRPRNSWNHAFENYYAVFVEKLFNYPLDEDLTWSNLHDVLRNEEHNILFNYYSLDEEEDFTSQPDCADLPYVLRAYFAWKLGLPFGFRRCNRGRAGRPPTCDDVQTNLVEREHHGNVAAFRHYANRVVANGVHSGTARTAPDYDNSDLYPVPITREALRPGTVYADPDGHLLVVAGWVPQTLSEYGVLYAADAQPDGTIGRRRFWRGSFLFRPETDSVGAGFKTFRPLIYRRGTDEMRTLSNSDLAESDDYIPWSDQQYAGTKDDFYEAVEALINPRPLDPRDMQASLVAALEEAVSRRVNSVNNGEEYMESANYRTVEMPTGYDLFETSGPWEDFSTPARDMRMLISLDTVEFFVDTVRRNPHRFGIDADNIDDAIAELEAFRDDELRARSISYTRSDGATQTIDLRELLNRKANFEMSYNPNDCPELRWGAPEGSEERATCDRRAPEAQQARMAEYREWFQNRRRPPRR